MYLVTCLYQSFVLHAYYNVSYTGPVPGGPKGSNLAPGGTAPLVNTKKVTSGKNSPQKTSQLKFNYIENHQKLTVGVYVEVQH